MGGKFKVHQTRDFKNDEIFQRLRNSLEFFQNLR